MDTASAPSPQGVSPGAPAELLTDPETGLALRVLLVEHLRMASGRHLRSGGQSGVLSVEIPGLDLQIQDLGPDSNRLVMGDLADRVRAAIRRSDSAARIEEGIVIMCNDVASPGVLEEIATRILISLTASPVRVGGRPVWPRVRVGLALLEGGGDPEVTLSAAREAAGRAPGSGRLSW